MHSSSKWIEYSKNRIHRQVSALDFQIYTLLQVPLVLNVESRHISPQFQIIFDDKFETNRSLPSNHSLDQQWAMMFSLG
jgi:hypothetical protein